MIRSLLLLVSFLKIRIMNEVLGYHSLIWWPAMSEFLHSQLGNISPQGSQQIMWELPSLFNLTYQTLFFRNHSSRWHTTTGSALFYSKTRYIVVVVYCSMHMSSAEDTASIVVSELISGYLSTSCANSFRLPLRIRHTDSLLPNINSSMLLPGITENHMKSYSDVFLL